MISAEKSARSCDEQLAHFITPHKLCNSLHPGSIEFFIFFRQWFSAITEFVGIPTVVIECIETMKASSSGRRFAGLLDTHPGMEGKKENADAATVRE